MTHDKDLIQIISLINKIIINAAYEIFNVLSTWGILFDGSIESCFLENCFLQVLSLYIKSMQQRDCFRTMG